ncbi:heterokaryon incompatibility protein-domain-containing protein [Microdochium trichocladiopsis]|uniref:Heterokaryon incompatibility protein-domain-containing protein n=1 Tax=Microdochium trichocladiopsis TaxID=1682393 RepID=A0A9P8XRK4_9PEZI|nr:heterokaryon incompatibility protein-domain-containing protein [Microdochium trichocladiopsis]KAH7010672.1 heterokaryon incompatibility protein-domain-containing protein [Microdochium trichocladiopsis]
MSRLPMPPPDHLCGSCAALDLESLVTAPWLTSEDARQAHAARPATDFEVERSVYIDDFSLKIVERRSTRCQLCQLVAACARMTGDEDALKDKHCCIRPKLVWASPARQADAPRLVHSGQLCVWFHELKRNQKIAPPVTPAAKISQTRGKKRSGLSDRGVSKSARDQLPDALGDGDVALSSGRELRDTPGSGPEAAENKAAENKAAKKEAAEDETLKNKAAENKEAENKAANAIIESAVGSWKIDILGKAFDSFRLLTQPHADLNMLQSWFNCCTRTHQHRQESEDVTARLASICNKSLFRVINTSTGRLEALSNWRDFAVLPYVWGTVPGRSHRRSAAQQGLGSYAPTLRDAAQLAKALGIEWLWVDRICIDQKNDKEKAALIPYIKDIFAGAQITIVAACGDGAHTGLSGAPGTPRPPETSYLAMVKNTPLVSPRRGIASTL